MNDRHKTNILAVIHDLNANATSASITDEINRRPPVAWWKRALIFLGMQRSTLAEFYMSIMDKLEELENDGYIAHKTKKGTSDQEHGKYVIKFYTVTDQGKQWLEKNAKYLSAEYDREWE
jgi:hypothetical protein